jgi:class 3 adenylate cyclase
MSDPRPRALVLVVDDQPDNIAVVRARLESQAYDVIEAADGLAALEQVALHRPDLVLLDIMMPRLDGIETVRRLKADQALPFIPVVMLTAQSDRKDVVAALDAGADEYLNKPIDGAALLARVRAMLRMKALHDEVRAQATQLEAWNRTLEQRVAEQLAELSRVAWLKRFLAPQVVELVASAGEDMLKSHRRNIAVVFCDLRGFTGFSEVSEPEEQMAMLADYHAALGTLIDGFQGTLMHLAGDGVMVVFNDPVPCPDPCIQAVLMAIEMRCAVSALVAQWQTHGYALGVGIGISNGYATLGLIGADGRSQYTAIGTVANLASRLCGEALDGQILVDTKVKTLVEGSFDMTDEGDRVLKGLHRPIRAFNVVGLRSHA